MKRSALVVLVFFLLPILASAQTVPELTRQIVILTNQLNALLAQINPPSGDFSFERDLFAGLQNDGDVRRLQGVLSSQGLFPDALKTGNFGPITRNAVVSYQAARGISRTGYVGPLTRAALNREPSLNYRIEPRPAYDLSALARSIADGINAERRARGLPELIWDGRIADVARLHSEDQARDNAELTEPSSLCAYPMIRHENWSGAFKVGDRLRAAGIGFRVAGENIIAFSPAENVLYRSDDRASECVSAREFTPGSGTESERKALFDAIFAERLSAARTSPVEVWINKQWAAPERIAARAVSGWMGSPGHRDNILTPDFTRGGVGIAIVNELIVATHVLLRP